LSSTGHQYDESDGHHCHATESDQDDEGWHSGASDTEVDQSMMTFSRYSSSSYTPSSSSSFGPNVCQLNAIRVASRQGNKRAMYTLLRLCEWQEDEPNAALERSTAIADAVVKGHYTVVQVSQSHTYMINADVPASYLICWLANMATTRLVSQMVNKHPSIHPSKAYHRIF
jgi:hypothetical protein